MHGHHKSSYKQIVGLVEDDSSYTMFASIRLHGATTVTKNNSSHNMSSLGRASTLRKLQTKENVLSLVFVSFVVGFSLVFLISIVHWMFTSEGFPNIPSKQLFLEAPKSFPCRLSLCRPPLGIEILMFAFLGNVETVKVGDGKAWECIASYRKIMENHDRRTWGKYMILLRRNQKS